MFSEASVSGKPSRPAGSSLRVLGLWVKCVDVCICILDQWLSFLACFPTIYIFDGDTCNVWCKRHFVTPTDIDVPNGPSNVIQGYTDVGSNDLTALSAYFLADE